MSRILLFGGSGQLGRECQKRSESYGVEILSPVSAEVDIANADQIERLVAAIKPDSIINCAAYTAVDQAESESERAYAVNALGPQFIAQAASKLGARLLHVSTDYVFSGDVLSDLGEQRPYLEADPTRPSSVYGKSKLAGEHACFEYWPEGSLIVRTSSLFGGGGPNFVLTMLKLLGREQTVKVVADQFMSPTWAGWLAEVLLQLVSKDITGIVHASCGGVVSWFEFAEEIARTMSRSQALMANLQPTTMIDYVRPAPRPQYSVMNCRKLEGLLGSPVLSWKDALSSYLQELL